MGYSDYEENTDSHKTCNLCRKFATILGANILVDKDDLCAVTFNRNLNVEILGRETQSPLVFAEKVTEAFKVLDR